MDHGMGENSGSNGILMEDEIWNTPSGPSQSQTVSPQAAQPQSGSSPQYGTAPQSAASPQYGTVPQSAASPQYGTVPQSTASPQYGTVTQSATSPQAQSSEELAAFNNAPSFDSMYEMDSSSGSGGYHTASSGWENQDSDMVFRGSPAGRMAGTDQTVIDETPSPNMISGLVGAVIGALIGAVLWVIIYQSGYVPGIAGVVIISLSIKGYALLGKGIDIKGFLLCAVLSIVTIYFAHRISFVIMYMNTMEKAFGTHMNFNTAYTNLDKFMKIMDAAAKAMGSDKSITSAYWRDLVVGYALSAVVGIPVAIKMIVRSLYMKTA